MHILHFVSNVRENHLELVAAACAGRGWRQAVVRAVETTPASADGCPGHDVMVRLERTLVADGPHFVLLYGDADDALAAAVASAKSGIRVARVEAGIRSGDRSQSNEVNRILIDRLATLLFTPSEAADEALSGEGVTPDRVRRVGPLSADAAERIADHLESEAQPGAAQPEGLKAPPVERIIEAQL